MNTLWMHKSLGELADIQIGKTPYRKNQRYWDRDKRTGNVWLSIADLIHGSTLVESKEYISDEACKQLKIVPKGTLLLSFKLTIGRVSFAGKDLFTNEAIAALTNLSSSLNKEFLFYYFTFFDWSAATEGDFKVKGRTLNKKKLKDLSVPLPPLAEQQRIVAILDEAFAAIDQAKANTERNLKNAKDLFESYLQEVFEKAASNFQMVNVGDVCKLTRGYNPPKSQFIYEPRKGYVRFYQIRDGGSDDYSVYVPDTSKLHKVKEDELLMVAYRHIGRVFRGVSGAFNVALCKITNKFESKLDNDYLFNIIPTDFVRGELLKRSERSLIPSMSVEHLKELKIPLPPLKEQQTIVHQLEALRAETQKLEAGYQKKLSDLDELKKSILQKAFAGELTTA